MKRRRSHVLAHIEADKSRVYQIFGCHHNFRRQRLEVRPARIFPPPLQGGDGDEPAPVSEVATAPGSEAPVGRQCRCGARAHMVGYESASQFSREYARMFGTPPARDAERLRGNSIAEVGKPA